MKAFLVTEMAADDEAAVREKALSTIGSKHKMKRWQIKIDKVEEIPADQVQSHVVKYQIGA